MTIPVIPSPEVRILVPMGHPWYRTLMERIKPPSRRTHVMVLMEGMAQMFQLAEASETFTAGGPVTLDTTWKASAVPFSPKEASRKGH